MRSRHIETKILPYPKEVLYNIVANVERYPNFIPWVSKVRVLNRYFNVIEYEMNVDFKVVSEKFSTRDTFYKNEAIEICLIDGPFSFLHNTWRFEKIDDNNTKITFFIEFEFKNKLLGVMFSKIFIQAQRKILDSFDKRAKEVMKILINNN